jgi:hypothetical protein
MRNTNRRFLAAKLAGLLTIVCLSYTARAETVTIGTSSTDNLVQMVTFGTSSIDNLVLAGVQVEGPFEYQALTGLGWEIVNTADARGNPPSALATYFNRLPTDQNIGDEVAFRLTSGGLFRFLSVDTRVNFNPPTSDRVLIAGTRNGALIGEINPLPTVQYTTTSGFDGLIDTLTVRLTRIGNNAFWIDNVRLAIVPEPATFATMGLALFCLAIGTRRLRFPYA